LLSFVVFRVFIESTVVVKSRAARLIETVITVTDIKVNIGRCCLNGQIGSSRGLLGIFPQCKLFQRARNDGSFLELQKEEEIT